MVVGPRIQLGMRRDRWHERWVQNRLTNLIGLKVDLVMKDTLGPRIAERLLKDLVPV